MVTNSTICPSQNEFEGYLSGKLPTENIVAFENHLQQCPLCLEAIAGYKIAFKKGAVNPVLRQGISQPKYHLSKRLIPYAAAVTVFAALGLSQILNWWPAKNNLVADNVEVEQLIKKTLTHKSDADYWYIGSENKIAFNDQLVSPNDFVRISKLDSEVKQVIIELDESNFQKAEEIVSTIRSNKTVPVYTYTKHQGLKKN